MCTVSFIPTRNGIFITSNRDEKTIRAKAIPPREHSLTNGIVCFPKDAKAGGTWIAAHENGNAMVLLNGAQKVHNPLPEYKKSRGLIFTDILSQENMVHYFQFVLNLTDIEPFTLLIWQENQLYECIWDGSEKNTGSLDKTRAHIRSSVTLYNEAIRQKRESWFAKWLENTLSPQQEDILHFHEFTGDGNTENDLKMNRNEVYKTVSITGIYITDKQVKLVYKDLLSNEVFTNSLNLKLIAQ